ncbi:hypothetical protein ACFOZ0_09930 [Streptomyces yaanensis]|uniref:Uncharacterized protein n=1 Tax=Streptomyces yaanensis TaxID=1142239 RepID=A0ABV7SD43_9ACTN|nr:hypothetical protein [Streptomyces sp. CGMCC 4.7035]WNB96673.1 hypothetical protein Q2K21_00520 [Streptomyces sp. CGMCC 4.7035]
MLRRTAARYSRSVAAALIAVAALTMAAHTGPAGSAEPGPARQVEQLQNAR